MSEDREQELKKLQDEAEQDNKTRSGVGTRKRVGQTRGKASMVISWEAFDISQPETLPKSIKEFTTVTGVTSEADLLAMVIDGYNDSQYTAASDPIAEFVEASWPDDVKAQFRLVVRNYSKAIGASIEDAVALIKPGIVKAQAANKAA